MKLENSIRLARRAIIGAAIVLATSAIAAVTKTDTSTEKATGFEDGQVSPFSVCVYQAPNYGQVVTTVGGQDGTHSLKFWFSDDGYDGTRLSKGVEACSTLSVAKEGWIGYSLYVPSVGYPTDKNTIITQVFCPGGCNSWAGVIHLNGNSLQVEHRGGCGTSTVATIVGSVQRNAWKQVIIHFKFSAASAGLFEVWYNGSKVYSATGINFGLDTAWSNDSLTNPAGLKIGQYCSGFTAGLTRTLYFDAVTFLNGNPSNAYSLVNPAR